LPQWKDDITGVSRRQKGKQRVGEVEDVDKEDEEDETESDNEEEESIPPVGGNIEIVMLDGEKIEIAYSPHLKIFELKNRLCALGKGLKSAKQLRLVYKGCILKDAIEKRAACLWDYKVPANSTLQLILLLHSLDSKMGEVIFDLNWGWVRTRDFLDVSCLLYASSTFLARIDYEHNIYPDAMFIIHYGDHKEPGSRGRQKINVNVSEIPDRVTHLFFVLSSWKSGSLSHYASPGVTMYDITCPDKELCEYNIASAGNTQAVIMCAMVREEYGEWTVQAIGRSCSGNADQYAPIKSAIAAYARELGWF
jgi:stress response protein SCP2